MATLIAHSVLVIDFDGVRASVLGEAEATVGWSSRSGRSLEVREHDDRTAIVVHVAQARPRRSSGSWHPLSDGAGRQVGFVTPGGAYGLSGEAVLRMSLFDYHPRNKFGPRSIVRTPDRAVEVASIWRLGRRADQASTVGSRFLSGRYRLHFASMDTDVRRLVIGAAFLQHVSRLDD